MPDLSKKELTTYAADLVHARIDETGDILGLLVQAAKLELFANALKDKAKAYALDAVYAYGERGVTRSGVGLTVGEVGTKYHYDSDPIWQRLNDREKEAADRRKTWEQVLRCLPSGGQVILDEETGDLYTARRPAKTSKTSVIISVL